MDDGERPGVEVARVVVRMGAREVEMTLAEARELYEALRALLGKGGVVLRVERVEVPVPMVPVVVPAPVPYVPPSPGPPWWTGPTWVGDILCESKVNEVPGATVRFTAVNAGTNG